MSSAPPPPLEAVADVGFVNMTFTLAIADGGAPTQVTE